MSSRKTGLNLGGSFYIGATIDAFQSLGSIKQLALESHALIGEKSWTAKSLEDTESSEKDIRTGFIGRIAILEARLAVDGPICDTVSRIAMDGLLFELDMEYMLTGMREPISVMAGLAIGNGLQRFEVRAYDLETKRFGRIQNEEVQNYLAKSVIKGAGTAAGKTTRRSTGLGSIRSSQ